MPRRSARRRVLCAGALLAACEGATSSLGVLRARDAGPEAALVEATDGGAPPAPLPSMRCSVAFEGAPFDRIATRPDGEPPSLVDDREVLSGGPWDERGSALLNRPEATFVVADRGCPGGGLRRAWRAVTRDAGVTVDALCLGGSGGARRVQVGQNSDEAGACVDLLDAQGEGFVAARFAASRESLTRSERQPWSESRCFFSAQHGAVVAVDGMRRRWFQPYDNHYLPAGVARALPQADALLRPRGLVESGAGWLAFWQGPDGGAPSAPLERLATDGSLVASEDLASWFPGASSVRVYVTRPMGQGAVALLGVEGGAAEAIYAVLACPDGRHRVRRLFEGRATWANLVEAGTGLALFVERDAGTERSLEVALADTELTWRREPRRILSAPSLVFHDAISDEDSRYLVVWHSRASGGGASSLRVSLLDFGLGL